MLYYFQINGGFMKQSNFHTHTWRCNHAMGSDEEYVITAIENDYDILGFSDHSCWHYHSNFKPRIRMKVSEFPHYKRSVLTLKKKYENDIDIRLGMEAEYFPSMMDWMLDFCIDEKIDYLIFGNHYYLSDETNIYFGYTEPEYIQKYFDQCIEGMETGMYAYLAHPELIMRNQYIGWNDTVEEGFHKICQTAKKLDMPLEFNVLGMQFNKRTKSISYPHPRFWQIASQYNNKAIIGMDAHQTHDLNKELYLEARNNLSKYSVIVVDDIPNIDYLSIKAKKALKDL